MADVLHLNYIPEPRLTFRFFQEAESPQDGLFLYGPLEENHPKVIRAGVIGTKEGIGKYKNWVETIQKNISPTNDSPAYVSFPGFEAAFNAEWSPTPYAEIEVDKSHILDSIRTSNRNEGIYNTVSAFSSAIEKYLREEEARPDLWFVVIPEEIHTFGRPRIPIPVEERTPAKITLSNKKAQELINWPSLFPEDNLKAKEAAKIYKYEKDFRAQLKARLLKHKQVIQIVRETTIEPTDKRRLQDPSTVAWNLCTTTFFKAGGKPWKIANIREGVCYIGLVFKKSSADLENKNACCAAQMFLSSGDGLVFRGALGPWYSPDDKQFHLGKEEAKSIISSVLEGYAKTHNGETPKELFIHGKTRFNDDEWEGFNEAAGPITKIIGVRINKVASGKLKLFTQNDYPVLRGSALKINPWRGYLWASGFVPRLQTYQGPETPNPLEIEIQRGEFDLDLVFEDIMALTKVNFNACKVGDGLPVTLRFADSVGAILTASPYEDFPPLPFKHYI